MRRAHFLISLIAFVNLTDFTLADCLSRPIGVTEKVFVNSLFKRMKPLGVRDISKAGVDSGRDEYIMSGLKTSLFLTPQSDLIKEIGFVLSEPADATDTEKLVTAGAFSLSKLSGATEQSIKDRIYEDLRKNDKESIEFFGSAAVVIAKLEGGTVFKISLTSCSP